MALDDSSAGLVVYRASRLEALLDPLSHLLDTQPPADVLAPQTVIAAHPGMRHWLTGALARRRGTAGVVANLNIVLASAWLDRLAVQVLGAHAVSVDDYRREPLRWRIHRLLESGAVDGLADYLTGRDAARRRFQLADRLARLYAQYMVYRPDWLQAWTRGERPARDRAMDAGFIAPLWRQLRRQMKSAHRGEVMAQLHQALAAPGTPPAGGEPLHVFGVSHLPPMELQLLRAVARTRPVMLYVPDPCRERWAGLQNDRQVLREKVRVDAFGADTEALFLEQEHPLLAQWGRLGQHFVLALEEGDDAVRMDVRHWRDEQDEPGRAHSRLSRVQDSVRRLAPALMAPEGDASAQRADASLRVHVCHTRLRELEVLRDALLRQLRDDPSLRPSDIVVMAPDIAAYLPLLPAVFGTPGRFDGPLPYHLADVAVARAHPLFEAFRRLLDLPRSRMTAPDVLDLAGMPEVARRFGLSAGDLELLAQWLSNARVAWALDARFRERLGVPALDAHTFAWGMDRMLAGYLLGTPAQDQPFTITLPDGVEIAPLDGVHGTQAAALGAFDALLVELADAHADGQRTMRASQWAQRLEARLDGVLRVDPNDGQARDARALLLRFIRELASEPAQAGLDPELAFDVVRELLLQRLDSAPERQQFLMGGATFCGMVPQRAIPFGVIAVLGLNEGEFPRGGDDGLDLMHRHRRLGDRDVRSDDRYLFLETLMSARVALHLSYVGEDVRDGRARNPAAPLAELLAALDAAAGLDDDAPDTARPWQVRHPLQPFDARYFDGGDAALYSFRREFAQMVNARPSPARPFFHAEESAPTPPALPDTVPLREWMQFYRDPARQLLAGGLRLRLDALDAQRLPECEPMDARFERLDSVATRVLLDALEAGQLPDAPPAWLRLGGLLPPGVAGEHAWREERALAQRLLDRCRAHPLFASGMPPRRAVQVDARIDGLRVRGELRHCYAGDGADWVVQVVPGRREEALDFKARIALFVEWALLRLELGVVAHGARLCIVCEDGARDWEDSINTWDERFTALAATDAPACDALLDGLRTRLAGLLHFWLEAQHAPSWYFPRTSWAAATGKDAAQAWRGGSHATGERDYAPGYAGLLAGERSFEPGTEDHRALLENAQRLRALVELDEPVPHA